MALISVYGINDFDYESNGAAILSPLKASVVEEAGGRYEMSLEHPVDARGVWTLLVPGNILKASVPATDIESAITGENVDVWRVKSAAATVYAKPVAPQRITYQAWNINSIEWLIDAHVLWPDDPYLKAGAKWTYNDQNYEVTTAIWTPAAMRIPPPQNPGAWKKIANYTAGSAELTKLAPGTEFYLVSEYSASWLYIQTNKGILGYVQKSYCEYVRTETVEPIEARSVRTQLFRIYEATADGAKRAVSVKARHVSYDLSGNLIRDCSVSGADAATTLSRIRAALLFDEECTLATNLSEDDGTYSGDFSWKNPINALLDPDVGLVSAFRARCVRDNWDIFLEKNTPVDRGIRLRRGSNLTGVSWKQDTSKLINRVVPVAQKANGTELLLEDTWVDSPVLDTYPVIITEYLKVQGKVGGPDESEGTWTEASLREHMRAKAEQRFSVDNVDKPIVEVTVQFILLGNTAEYRQYKELERVCMYDTVRAIDPVLNLDVELQVSQYDWDPVKERFNSVKLGNVFEKRSALINSYNIIDGSIRYNKLSPDTILNIKEAIS